MIKCPHCSKQLNIEDNTYTCSSKHSFDISKEGYINLLLGNHKTSGDDKMMVKARRDFLETGLYSPFVEKISMLLPQDSLRIGDFGCGEGWYVRVLQELRNGHDAYTGIDISKEAVKYCAKHTNGLYIAGNTNTPPYMDNSFDLILSIFSPYKESEIYRCLDTNGKAIIVGPGQDHLYDFIEMIRDKPHKHIIKDSSEKYEQLMLKESHKITVPLLLEDNQTIRNLFMMTPYYWKAPKEKQDRILHLERLETQAEFIIDLVQK